MYLLYVIMCLYMYVCLRYYLFMSGVYFLTYLWGEAAVLTQCEACWGRRRKKYRQEVLAWRCLFVGACL